MPFKKATRKLREEKLERLMQREKTLTAKDLAKKGKYPQPDLNSEERKKNRKEEEKTQTWGLSSLFRRGGGASRES